MMSRDNLWCVLALLVVIPNGGSAAGAGVDLTFNGTLLDTQCRFEREDAPLLVTLPSRSVQDFSQYGRTPSESFDIGLKDCTAAMQGKLVTMMFSGAKTQTVGGIMMLAAEGGTGLVIGLEDGAGSLISLGKPVTAGQITVTGSGQVNRFRFGAYALAPDRAAVKEGPYTATATFEVSYQ
ncbi:fimbrial protein [Yersinia bercovieri]|uniref:fimbrial protein n=1 Tax=Yersinia bercovieri TaxID=634 RepID=UPI0021654212|nr:fimbrial protein [Yersinia bercovieri]